MLLFGLLSSINRLGNNLARSGVLYGGTREVIAMFCDRCGAQMPDQAQFCPSCGKPVGGTAAASTPGRVVRHVRVLAIFWLVLSAFHLIPGLAIIGLFGPGFGAGRRFIPGLPFFVHGIVSSIGFIFLIVAILGLAAGWGLLQREPWARMLAIVMGVLNLFDPPFGTAVGIYTLWVLLPADCEREYRQLPRTA
jgi:zinc-ribbon domain